LSVSILTGGYWPSNYPMKLNLPVEMTDAMELFKNYYAEIKRLRSLNWSMARGSMVIASQFGRVVYDIQVMVKSFHCVYL
jgi:hypothetical protein